MQRIETHPAFMWDCPECGREQFGRMITPDDPDLLEELQEGHGIMPWESVQWCMKPTHVSCNACGVEYEIDEGNEDDDA